MSFDGHTLAPRGGFRYLGQVRFVSQTATSGWRLGLVLAMVVSGALACKERAKTPAAAYQRFSEAVAAKDAQRLYAALDLETRWSWMSVRRAHREAYDIVLSNVPEGAAREQQLRRFEAGALADNEAAMFERIFPAERWNELGPLPKDVVPQPISETEAKIPLPGGRSLPFRRGEDGGWGFAGLAGEAEQAKRRAAADLEVTRSNAADLERAATRSGN